MSGNRYYVYVVELEPAVAELGSFRRQNPRYLRGPNRPPLYVGSSALPPTERIEQHRGGYKSSQAVHRHFVRTRWDLFERGHWTARSRRRIEHLERRRAETLRERGYGVWQG